MNRSAVGKPGALFRRFAPVVIAAYLLHWGIWDLLFVAEQVVMSALTKTINWVAFFIFINFHIFGNSQFVEEESVSLRYLTPEVAYGSIQVILALLVGWWVWRKRRKRPQDWLQASQSN